MDAVIDPSEGSAGIGFGDVFAIVIAGVVALIALVFYYACELFLGRVGSEHNREVQSELGISTGSAEIWEEVGMRKQGGEMQGGVVQLSTGTSTSSTLILLDFCMLQYTVS